MPLQLDNFPRPELFIINTADFHIFAAERNPAGPDVIEAVAEKEPGADAGFRPVAAKTLGEIAAGAEAVRLIEDPGLDKINAGSRKLGPGFEAQAKRLASARERAVR